jgi:phage-related baseplate assembly protein
VNYRYNPVLIREPQNKETVLEEAEEVINMINYIQTQLSRDIKFINLYMVIYYNRKHGSALDLKKGEKV